MAEPASIVERRTPAVARKKLELACGARARLSTTGFASLLNLRGSADNGEFVSGVQRVLGVSLPLTPNHWHDDHKRIALWLGPDEWLIITSDGEAAAIEKKLRDASADDSRLSVVDVSASYTGFVLAGTAAREVLAKGCLLDLHPSAFGSGQCAQTVLAGTRVTLRVTDDFSAIEIWVRNSFARYLAEWLADAMAEYRA
jgi:sarcosine oxidase subunit gamma